MECWTEMSLNKSREYLFTYSLFVLTSDPLVVQWSFSSWCSTEVYVQWMSQRRNGTKGAKTDNHSSVTNHNIIMTQIHQRQTDTRVLYLGGSVRGGFPTGSECVSSCARRDKFSVVLVVLLAPLVLPLQSSQSHYLQMKCYVVVMDIQSLWGSKAVLCVSLLLWSRGRRRDRGTQ